MVERTIGEKPGGDLREKAATNVPLIVFSLNPYPWKLTMLIKSRCKSLPSHHGNIRKAFHTQKAFSRHERETSVHYPPTVFPKQTLKPVIIPAAYSGAKVDFFIYIIRQDKEKNRQSVLLLDQVRRYKPWHQKPRWKLGEEVSNFGGLAFINPATESGHVHTPSSARESWSPFQMWP